ncbi:hypothetical protein ACWCXB_17910 [Streptomyces sp. NPDC001514]
MKKSLTVATAASAALLFGATGATAAESAPAPAESSAVLVSAKSTAAAPMAAAATCTLKLGKPWKENIARVGRSDHARGTYSTLNNCSGFALSATLQYHRWHGWSGLSSASWAGNRSTRILQWKCQGKGTFTYRMYGTVRGGSTGEEPRVGRGWGPERRFSC